METVVYLDNLLAARWAQEIERTYNQNMDVFCKKCDDNKGDRHTCDYALSKQVMLDPKHVARMVNFNFESFALSMQGHVTLEEYAQWRKLRKNIHCSFIEILTLIVNTLRDHPPVFFDY